MSRAKPPRPTLRLPSRWPRGTPVNWRSHPVMLTSGLLLALTVFLTSAVVAALDAEPTLQTQTSRPRRGATPVLVLPTRLPASVLAPAPILLPRPVRRAPTATPAPGPASEVAAGAPVKVEDATAATGLTLGERVAEAAIEAIGAPYGWGGVGNTPCDLARPGEPPRLTDAPCFDCSGLVHWAYAAAGRPLGPRMTAQGQWERLGIGQLPFTELQPGDLVFFTGPPERPAAADGHVEHVGIYVGRAPDGVPVMIHAPDFDQTVRAEALGPGWTTERYVGTGRWQG